MSLAEQHEWLARPVGRRGVLRAGAVIGLSLGSTAAIVSALPDAAGAASALIGRQIAYGPDPTREMIVAFAVDRSVGSAQVRVRASSGDRHEAETRGSVSTVAGTAVRYVRARLTGLRPGTGYQYWLVLDGRSVSSGHFHTARSGGHKFRFTAFGDQGVGTVPRQVLAQVERLAPSVHLFAGDLSYSDQSGLGGPGDIFKPVNWDRWINQNDSVAAKTPFMCVPGNHEMEPGFALHGYAGMLTRVPIGGSSPLGVPVASAFQIGTVGFVGLDSNDVSYEIPANRGWTGNRQTEWLHETLRKYRAAESGVDFIVAFLHASPYTTNRGHVCEGGVRQAWVPLFDQYTVDLVISGHNHCYERTLPIRNGQPVSARTTRVNSYHGTTYVVAGGGGASVGNYHFDKSPFVHVSSADGSILERAPWRIPSERSSEHCVVCVDVAPADRVGGLATMTLKTIDTHGEAIDHVVLSRTSSYATPTTGTSNAPYLLGGGGLLAAGGATATGVLVHRRRSGRPQDGESPAP